MENIRPLFSDKQKDLQHEFILIENDEVISDEQDIAEKMNYFFVDVTENLGIEPFIAKTENEQHFCNSIEDIVKRYSQHPSILKIKQHVTITDKLFFRESRNEEFQEQI